jgi:phosphate uptake regulator
MKRKVIQIGTSTQLISLPKSWAVQNNVKKGDELDVRVEGAEIVVSTGQNSVIKRVTIDVSKMKTLRRRHICAAYLHGYNEIETHFSSPEYIEVLQSILPEFAGLDIVKQSKTSCLIKQISMPQAGEFESVFNRLFLLIHDTFQYIIEATEKRDKEMLNSVRFRERNINKYANFCRRLIATQALGAIESSPMLYSVLSYLEHLGDELKGLALQISSAQTAQGIMPVLKESSAVFDGVYRLYLQWRSEAAVENALKNEALAKQIMSLAGKTDAMTFYYLRRINELSFVIQETLMHANIGREQQQQNG